MVDHCCLQVSPVPKMQPARPNTTLLRLRYLVWMSGLFFRSLSRNALLHLLVTVRVQGVRVVSAGRGGVVLPPLVNGWVLSDAARVAAE